MKKKPHTVFGLKETYHAFAFFSPLVKVRTNRSSPLLQETLLLNASSAASQPPPFFKI